MIPHNDGSGTHGLGMDQGEQEHSQLPLGIGDEPVDGDLSLDPLGGASAAKRSLAGPLLIGLVVVVAVVGLFSMRTISSAVASSEPGEEVAAAIDDITRRGNEKTKPRPRLDPIVEVIMDEKITEMNSISEPFTNKQVRLDQVQKNPFELGQEIAPPPPPPTSAGPDPAVIIAERKAEITKAAAKLQVTSIMTGASPMALVNGELRRLSDMIVMDLGKPTPDAPQRAVAFEITAIEKTSVTVSAEDVELGIRMEFDLIIER